MPDTTPVLEIDLSISVVIPAHNAAETIAETLESLLAQTYPNWEAVVVDDGSRDGTAAIAARFAEQDSRIHIVSQPQMGVSAARNIGVGFTHYDWLLFLDADDWISKEHLERMTSAIASDPSLDAVHCGWARVAPDGTLVGEKHWPQTGDLFAAFVKTCAFAIHSCVVRRSLIEGVGGFDTSLRTCEDWDLWQKIARTGACFGAIPTTLAYYRMRADAASVDGAGMLADAIRVITQGYSLDTRVTTPHPTHLHGLPAEQLSCVKLQWACWSAGLELGRGRNAQPLLRMLKHDRGPELDPYYVAWNLFESALLPTCQPPTVWDKLWPKIELYLDEFLLALEVQAQAPKLARRARRILERLVLQHSAVRPLTIGTTHAVQIEVTQPISDIHPPATAELLHCTVELEGTRLGIIELPVCEGLVPSYVLVDAITAQFAWPILGRFFERTVYRELRIVQQSTGLSLQRGTSRLADGLSKDEEGFWQRAHDQIGWTVFLQEIWAHPDWPSERFYDSEVTEEAVEQRWVNDSWLAVEVSEDLPEIKVSAQKLDIVLTVGGVALGTLTVPVTENVVSRQELRVALTIVGGLELCRACVREGLLGKPLAESPISLRSRLSIAAMAAAQLPDWIAAPGSARAIGQALSAEEQGVVLGQRTPYIFGTSASRRAMLPIGAAHELVNAAAITREPIIQVPLPGKPLERVVYAPDLIWHPSRCMGAALSQGRLNAAQTADATAYGRNTFETFFATQPDPWKYTSPYEQTKYEQTLALLPPEPIERALELACAEGHFTVQLAPRVSDLVATDISQIALERAAKRCAGLKNIRFMHLDLIKEPLPGRFGLIVCSEVLYYLDGQETLESIVHKIANALEPGGYFLTAHANLVVDQPDRTGFDWDHPFGAKVIGETFACNPSLRFVKEIQTPLYRIQLFQRRPRTRPHFQRKIPTVIELAQPTPLPPEVEAQVLWNGGSPRRYNPTQVTTDRLPILMYHRVIPNGSPTTARYRVTPERFEEQLHYLRDAGFYSVGLDDWYTAMQAKKPLPGRAVLITFDDGYLDFLTYAWPLLKRYGFSATVFLVTDLVGTSNSWDYVYGEEIPLLGWREIGQLRDEGVKFGSHSASHQPLTALLPEEVVREGARSRSLLEYRLGVPIKTFAYPYGDCDQAVQHLIGACGYTFGLSCRTGLSRFQDSLLALPRIEVTGSDNLQDFVTKLSS